MIASDIIRAAISLALGILALASLLPLWLLLVLIMILESVGTFYFPASMALVPEIVPEEHLAQANGTTQSVRGVANLIGQLAGGIIMAALGPVLLFFANGVSFLVSVVSLGLMRVKAPPWPAPTEERKPGLFAQWHEGFQILTSSRTMRILIAVTIIGDFALQSVTVLGAAWVKGPLHAGPLQYGLFGASNLAGLITGSLLSAMVVARIPMHRLIAYGIAGMGLSVVCMSRIPLLPVSFGAVFMVGCFIGMINTGMITYLQKVIPRGGLGRIFGILTALTGLATPVGAAVFGALAAVWPLSLIFLVAGLVHFTSSLPVFTLTAPVEMARDAAG